MSFSSRVKAFLLTQPRRDLFLAVFFPRDENGQEETRVFARETRVSQDSRPVFGERDSPLKYNRESIMESSLDVARRRETRLPRTET